MPFNYNVDTDVGKVRFEIGDTVSGSGILPDGSNFQDEEIDTILTDEGSIGRASARLLEVAANRYAGLVDITVGPRRERLSQAAEGFAKRAEAMRDEHGGGAAKTVSASVIRVDGFSKRTASDISVDATDEFSDYSGYS